MPTKNRESDTPPSSTKVDKKVFFTSNIERDVAGIELRNNKIYGKMVMLRWLKFLNFCKFERKITHTVAPLKKMVEESNRQIYVLKELIQELLERQKHLEETVNHVTKVKVTWSDDETSVLNESEEKNPLSAQVRSALTDILAEGTFDQYLRPKDSSLSHPVAHSHTVTRSPSERSNTNLNIQNLTSSDGSPHRTTVVYRPLLREAVIECPLKSPSTNVSIGRRTSYNTQHEKQDSNNPNSSPFDLQKRGQLFHCPSAIHQGKRQEGKSLEVINQSIEGPPPYFNVLRCL
eukprot:Tbor_TRINITY_DN5409_c0_g1::TRINITY_DN5409_c0_g1_i3::g.24241::m.24241